MRLLGFLRRHGLLSLLLTFSPLIALADDTRLPLWEVRGARATVYLFGSIHVCRAGCYPLPSGVLQRFDAAREIAVEVDPARGDLQERIMRAALLPVGERLSDLLGKADGEALQHALNELDLPAQPMMGMRPWMVGTMIGITAAQRAGLRADQGVDLWLLARARTQGKTVNELETVQRQIDALQGTSLDEQVEGLRQTLSLLRDHRLDAYFDDLVRAWQRGDGERLDALIREGGGSDDRWRAELLDRRNAEMADKIAGWLDDGRAPFVIVGVGHLAGQGSVVDRLGQRGYVIRQLAAGD